MTSAFDRISAGLKDARAYLKGERAGFAVHAIEVPDPDVVAIRNKTGLSQPAFCPEHRYSRPYAAAKRHLGVKVTAAG